MGELDRLDHVVGEVMVELAFQPAQFGVLFIGKRGFHILPDDFHPVSDDLIEQSIEDIR